MLLAEEVGKNHATTILRVGDLNKDQNISSTTKQQNTLFYSTQKRRILLYILILCSTITEQIKETAGTARTEKDTFSSWLSESAVIVLQQLLLSPSHSFADLLFLSISFFTSP